MLLEWEIEKREFFKRLGCNEQNFKSKLCLPNLKSVHHIIPLRYLKSVESIVPISQKLLLCIVIKMTTLDGQKPFLNSSIEFRKIDPSQLLIGQKFVYRENYQDLLEGIPDLFGKFAVPSGISDLGAYFVFGKDKNDISSLACYIPPFAEQHNNHLVIMDGIHRNFMTKQLGATINTILIRNISVAFPCAAHPWSDIKVIPLTEKPKEVNDRYFNLQKNLFRDLKYLGIDG